MKFLYVSDLHGDKLKYEKILSYCVDNNISNLVVGGDLFSKIATYRIPVQKEFIHNYLYDYFKRLNSYGIKYIGIVGNDDLVIPCQDYYEIIKEFPLVFDINQKKVDIDGISFIGLNYVLDAPFKRKDNVALEKNYIMPNQVSDVIYVDNCTRTISKEEWVEYRKNCPMMEDLLDNLPKPTVNNKTIYVFHDPPYGVGLDVCYGNIYAGSKAIYNFLKDSNAYMSLHGHIHESYELSGVWKVLIGNTIAIQTGQTDLNANILHCVLIDTDKNTQDFLKLEI